MSDVQPDDRPSDDISTVLSNSNSSSATSAETSSPKPTTVRSTSSSTERSHSTSDSKPSRTPKQLAAFERMRANRNEKRKLGAQPDTSESSKDRQRSIEEASAMFMDMRRREKETKKELKWEALLDKRMHEFEDRLVGLFNEPVEQYVEKRRRKSAPPPSPVEIPTPKDIDPVMEEEPDKIELKEQPKQRYVSKSSPFAASRRK